jgi:multidrug transporter EmrE-like cation transporter
MTGMTYTWLTLAIVATVGYHLVLKLTPAGVNPLVSLMATYALVTVCFGAVLLATQGGHLEWRAEVRHLNWTAIALAVAIVGLDLGFLYLYRSGFEVSLGALVTQSAAALVLLAIGVAFFKEQLTIQNAVGLVFCLAGLWLVNRR